METTKIIKALAKECAEYTFEKAQSKCKDKLLLVPPTTKFYKALFNAFDKNFSRPPSNNEGDVFFFYYKKYFYDLRESLKDG